MEPDLKSLEGKKVIFWGAYQDNYGTMIPDNEKAYLFNDKTGNWFFINRNPIEEFSDGEFLEDYLMIVYPNFKFKKEFYEKFGEFIEV